MKNNNNNNKTDLAPCDSVHKAGYYLWIQRQTLHGVDGFTGKSPVIYHQLVKT